jgi:hypothetical protein
MAQIIWALLVTGECCRARGAPGGLPSSVDREMKSGNFEWLLTTEFEFVDPVLECPTIRKRLGVMANWSKVWDIPSFTLGT